jgi:predicted 3-demethylubiquinone-9 3-methyltransferase (glyoxalase superfamily)
MVNFTSVAFTLLYGEALGNAAEARRFYMERFPQRQILDSLVRIFTLRRPKNDWILKIKLEILQRIDQKQNWSIKRDLLYV